MKRLAFLLAIPVVILIAALAVLWPRPEERIEPSGMEVLWNLHENQIIARFELRNTTVEQATESLNRLAAELPGPALRFVIWREGDAIPSGLIRVPPRSVPEQKEEPVSSPQPITINISDIPVLEAARYVSSLAGLDRHGANDTMWFYPPTVLQPQGIRKEFYLMFDLMDYMRLTEKGLNEEPEPKVEPAPERIDLAAHFTKQGVKFRPGDFAYFEPKPARMVVNLSPEGMDLVETMFPNCFGSTWATSRWDRIRRKASYSFYNLKEQWFPSPPPPPPPMPTSDPLAIPGLDPTPGAEPAAPSIPSLPPP